LRRYIINKSFVIANAVVEARIKLSSVILDFPWKLRARFMLGSANESIGKSERSRRVFWISMWTRTRGDTRRYAVRCFRDFPSYFSFSSFPRSSGDVNSSSTLESVLEFNYASSFRAEARIPFRDSVELYAPLVIARQIDWYMRAMT